MASIELKALQKIVSATVISRLSQ